MSDILKTAWTKIYAWALPTALVLGAYWLFVHPKTVFGQGLLAGMTETEKITIFAALTTVVATCLNALSTPLYRILEGYLLWPEWLQKVRVTHHTLRKQSLAETGQRGGWARGLRLEKLELYPKSDDQIAPTEFGNALRAFETYGKTRYNLDSQTLWYELNSVAPKYIVDEIGDARAIVDFFVAMIFLNGFLGLATLAIVISEGFQPTIALVGLVAAVLAYLFHRSAVNATREWRYAVQALVNVGRLKLAESMGLKLPDTLAREKLMWGLVTKYGFHAKEEDGAQLDQFRRLPTPTK